MTRILTLALLAAVSFASTGFAQQADRVGLGLHASTLGPTIEGTYRINDNWGVRVPVGGFSFDIDDLEGAETTVGSIGIGGVGLLADYYVNGGNFRFSGGVFYSNYDSATKVTGDARFGGGATVPNVDVDIYVEANQTIAPMLTLGYDLNLGNSWALSADLGAIYTGGFGVSVVDNNGNITAADLAAEVADINADGDDFKFLPYLKFGVGVKF